MTLVSASQISKLKKGKGKQTHETNPPAIEEAETEVDLGWKEPAKKSKKSAETKAKTSADMEVDSELPRDLEQRRRLLKELSARLERDRQLRYAEREFEMQRLLMGKGGKKKIQGVEKVEGDDEDEDREETQDEIDARRGRRQKSTFKVVDETTYRPRIYKWRLERKR